MMPVALAMNLPFNHTQWPMLVSAEIVSFVLAMGGMLAWRWMKTSHNGSHKGSRPLFADLYMTLLGLMGFTDALDPYGTWPLTLLALAVSAFGLLSHFRSVTWTLGYIAPHWDARASTAFATMGPSLVAGFSIGLAMLMPASHPPVIYAALAVIWFSIMTVSFFFTLSLRPSLALPVWLALVMFLYFIPAAGLIGSFLTHTSWPVVAAAVSTVWGLTWHTKEILGALPKTPYPGLFLFQHTPPPSTPTRDPRS